jgi:uncharacterized protein YcbK (DUF882 family)
MRKYYEHWTEVPKTEWYWPSFTPYELASRKGNGSILVDYDAISKLQILRDYICKPLVINSAYRDPVYNAKIGGAPLSMHKQGRAFDISLKGHDKDELVQAARLIGFGGIAYAKTFIHVDTGRVRTWKY